MTKILALLLLAITLSACSPNYDDAWRPASKFRPGDIVVFRLDGRTALVVGARYHRDENKFTYLVQNDRRWSGPHAVEEFEIAKAPQRTCRDSESTNGWLAYQEGDMAAEARCRRE